MTKCLLINQNLVCSGSLALFLKYFRYPTPIAKYRTFPYINYNVYVILNTLSNFRSI